MEDLNSVINSPAALKNFSASNEDSGNVCTQFFNFLMLLGILGWFKKHYFFLDMNQNILGLNSS